MSTSATLQHRTRYDYDRAVTLGPQVVRLRPAPHTRTLVPKYEMNCSPSQHYLHWQQDPFGNWQARVLFTEPVEYFDIQCELIARLEPFNPLDFFIAPEAAQYPFSYEAPVADALGPYLNTASAGDATVAFAQSLASQGEGSVSFLARINQAVHESIRYSHRDEPGVLEPDETLAAKEGSCRDLAWLMVQVLRCLGLGTRFVSGYQIHLSPGPGDQDHTELHAWCESYLPGAGWIGMDPSAGLFAAEGYIPAAATTEPSLAAPVSGLVSPCQSRLQYEMRVIRGDDTPANPSDPSRIS